MSHQGVKFLSIALAPIPPRNLDLVAAKRGSLTYQITGLSTHPSPQLLSPGLIYALLCFAKPKVSSAQT